jgi:hypothetical protein
LLFWYEHAAYTPAARTVVTGAGEDSEEKIINLILREVLFHSKLDHLLSDQSSFSDPSTPQCAALAWSANEDPAAVDEADQERLEIRVVLATIYIFFRVSTNATGRPPQGVSCDEIGQDISNSIGKNFA